LGEAGPSGTLGMIEAAWRERAAGAPAWFGEMTLSHLSSHAVAALPGLTGLSGRLALGPHGGAMAFDQADFKLDHAERLVTTLDVDGLEGGLRWHRRDGALDLDFVDLAGEIAGTRVRLEGRVSGALGDQAAAALALEFDQPDAARLHHLIPRGVLPPRGQSWARHVLHAGGIENGRVVLRGPLAALPFRAAEGVLAADFDVRDAEVEYSRRWPVATGVNGRVAVRGPRVTMTLDSADVLGARTLNGSVVMPDMFIRKRFVELSGTARGPAGSAAAIIMASPLKDGKAARFAALDIDGELEMDLDMNIGLYPGAPRDVLGQTRFRGNSIESPELRIRLDDVTGAVSFTRSDWYGEGLTATFRGNPVGLVANGGLDDPNYDSEFRMTGTPPAAEVLALMQRYAPTVHAWLARNDSLGALNGELPWKAVLTIPTVREDGTRLPQRLTLESSLHGLEVDLPWPFGKLAEERRPLRVEFELLDGVAARTRVDLGDTLNAEIASRRGPDGKAVVERMEVVFGSLEPEFTGAPGVTMTGYIPRLPLTRWTRFMRRAAAADGDGMRRLPWRFDLQLSELALLGQRFRDTRVRGERGDTAWQVEVTGTDAEGRLSVPLDLERERIELEFERLRLARPADENGNGGGEPPDPRRVPALTLNARSFVFDDIDLGTARIATSRLDDGLGLDEMTFSAGAFRSRASGRWLIDEGIQQCAFSISANDGSLGGLLSRFGYEVVNIEGGRTEVEINAHWPGTPADFELADIDGDFELHVADGRFLDIDPGGGRLFGLLSLQSLPRRLSLDFDDLFRKGFAFDNIDGVFELEDGNAYTNSLLMDGPAARIDISGRTGLASQDYDQQVVVTPALSSSLPIAGALFGPIGAGAGAVYFLGGKMFKSIPEQVNRFLSRKYTITGSWDNPSIERI
ncbi:MAG: YhdP family phospholipid transporter, partial [Gammaproteobacteria bacterium]